jgi:hypothetical protein
LACDTLSTATHTPRAQTSSGFRSVMRVAHSCTKARKGRQVCATTHPLSSPHRPRCRALHTQRSRSGCRSTELDPSSHTGTGCWPCTHRGQSSTAPKPTSQTYQQTISCHLLRCGQQYENKQVAWRDITAQISHTHLHAALLARRALVDGGVPAYTSVVISHISMWVAVGTGGLAEPGEELQPQSWTSQSTCPQQVAML